MRLLAALWCIFLLFPPVASAEEETEVVAFSWSASAGMQEELEGEQLELRDELIAAHLSYMAALEKALAEIGEKPTGDPGLPMLWARAEYLLETSYRLLDSTGEYQAFLKATAGFRPDAPAALEDVSLDAVSDSGADGDGGLVYRDHSDRELTPVFIDGHMALLADGEPIPQPEAEAVTAVPAAGGARTEEGYIPLIKARGAWLRALVLGRLGRMEDARQEVAGLGLIGDWAVLGPLDSETETYSYINYSLDDIYESLDVALSYPGKNAPVKWEPFSSLDPLRRVNPGAIFRSPGQKSALFLALVHSPENQPAVLRFGSSSPVTVCVNYQQSRRHRSLDAVDADQEAFNVWLRQGWNVVLVRTASVDDKWGVVARLTLPSGEPFAGTVIKPDSSNLGRMLAEARKAAKRSSLERFYHQDELPEVGGVSVLMRWLDEHPDDSRSNFYLASFLVSRRMMDGPERFDREMIFRRATELSGGDPFFTLMSSRSVDAGVDGPDREENLRLVLLKSVADQGSAAALVDIGRLYLDVMRQPRRADEYAELALEVNPMSLRAGVLDYDVAVDMEWEPVAMTLLERLAKRHPTAAAVRLRLGRAALNAGRHRQALTEFHAILDSDAGNDEALDGAVVSLGMLGQTSAAVELLANRIERFPYDFRVRLKLVELYRVLGRDDDARRVLDSALALAPEDPQAMSMRDDIHLESYAEGKNAQDGGARNRPRQELDLSPPKQTPSEGWEYLYFQIEDHMGRDGAIERNVSFALRIYTARAAKILRHLGFLLDKDFERGTVVRLNLIHEDGTRESYTPPLDSAAAGTLKFFLPPLRAGMTVEAEVQIRRERIPFLGDYFGQIAPLTQQAPIRLSRYMFTSNRDRRIFFKPANGAPEAMVVTSPDGQEITRIWEMSDLPAYSAELFAPGQHELMPCVQISSFSDWDEFARWYWRLIGVQYHTPPELRLLARSLAGEQAIPMARLDSAAAWVSRNIAHRDWEYGPYAFRPINARSILSRLSADGKDRTLLLCLLAREYGLEAWPVLARLRDPRFAPVGPDDLALPLLDHFNHSLTLVESAPGGEVFLDASNPYRPSGVMPSQLFGSPGIVITPGGARKVLIPDAEVAACDWDELADMVVDEDGSILWEQTVTGAGTAAEMIRMRFRGADVGDDEAWIAFLSSLGGVPTAASGEFHEDPTIPASADFNGRVRLRNWSSVVDDRVILRVPALPGTMSRPEGRFTFPLSLDELVLRGERDQELVLPHGFRIRRRLNIRYPESWRLVNPSLSFERKYDFGDIAVVSETTDGGIALDIRIEIPGHRIAVEDFQSFREMAALAERWTRPYLVWEKP